MKDSSQSSFAEYAVHLIWFDSGANQSYSYLAGTCSEGHTNFFSFSGEAFAYNPHDSAIMDLSAELRIVVKRLGI